MKPVNVSLLVFACAFGGALFGMFIKRVVPAHHISAESKEVVRVGMGMVATTVALVLGLLVYSTKGFYDTQTAEVTQLAANIVLLDRILAHYGPESAEVRAELQRSIQRHLELLWPKHDSRRPLIFWLIALFISFGLFAPSNFTVVVSLFVAAAAVCGAVFLMVEMYYP